MNRANALAVTAALSLASAQKAVEEVKAPPPEPKGYRVIEWVSRTIVKVDGPYGVQTWVLSKSKKRLNCGFTGHTIHAGDECWHPLSILGNHKVRAAKNVFAKPREQPLACPGCGYLVNPVTAAQMDAALCLRCGTFVRKAA